VRVITHAGVTHYLTEREVAALMNWGMTIVAVVLAAAIVIAVIWTYDENGPTLFD